MAGDVGDLSPSKVIRKAKPLIDIILDIHLNESTKHLMTSRDLRDQMATFLSASSDTTGGTVHFAIAFVASHPNVQSRLQAEIDERFGDGDLEVTVDDLKPLNYMEAVVKETMRLAPAGPVTPRRLSEDMQVKGHVIPKHTEVWMYQPGLYRRADLYQDPDKFVPERWLPGNEGQRSDKTFSFVPFSGGPRNCIGQKYAMHAIKVILCHVFKNFNVALVGKLEDIVLEFGLVLKSTKPITVKFAPRK